MVNAKNALAHLWPILVVFTKVVYNLQTRKGPVTQAFKLNGPFTAKQTFLGAAAISPGPMRDHTTFAQNNPYGTQWCYITETWDMGHDFKVTSIKKR